MAVLAAMYGIAWFAPAIGLAYSDGVSLATAVTHKGHASPPLFPSLLALLVIISRHLSHEAQVLKLVPLLSTLLWLELTRRLLTKMGASREGALLVVLMTAASPTVLYLGTGLFAEPLFGLLLTASLLALLDERPLMAGLLAGLATVTMSTGAVLIAAGLPTLVVHRRFRSALVFAGAAMAFAAPWLGWSLAHRGIPGSELHLSEMVVVLGNNAALLAAAPWTLLTGYPSLYPGLLTAVVLLIALVRRRQFVPDVFIGFYCLVLLCRTELPLYAFAPVLPLFLWMLWRGIRGSRFATVTTVLSALAIAPALWFDALRVRPAVTLGAVATENFAPDNWHEMERLFAFIRANTPADSVLMADLDPVFYLNTERRTVRGFVPDRYRSRYAPPGSLVTPDQLRASVLRDGVSYVALTPDRDLPESASYHKAVAALERGGVLEPVSVPGASGEYRLLRVATGQRP